MSISLIGLLVRTQTSYLEKCLPQSEEMHVNSYYMITTINHYHLTLSLSSLVYSQIHFFEGSNILPNLYKSLQVLARISGTVGVTEQGSVTQWDLSKVTGHIYVP